jgi:hypothetical protein
MRETYRTVIQGQILHGTTVAKCPNCRTDRGLTVYGYLGGDARLACPCGNDFPVPPPFDAELLMRQTATDARRRVTSLTYVR